MKDGTIERTKMRETEDIRKEMRTNFHMRKKRLKEGLERGTEERM